MSNRRRTTLGKVTAAERAYSEIRRAIVQGRYKVGERLAEAKLGEELGVSRTPIHSALQRLHAEGFVEVSSHAGAIVRGWSRRDAEEIFDIRATLEGMACGLAAENATSSDIELLSSLCDDMEHIVCDDGSLSEASEINRKFHAEILRISGNQRLMDLCETLMNLGFLFRSLSRFSTPQIERSLQHHRDLVRAIETGNREWASTLMTAHILSARDIFKGTEE